MRFDGCRAAALGGTWPPFDFSMSAGQSTPSSTSPASISSAKPPIRRFRYASTMTVFARSYSRQSGATSLDAETETCGSAARRRAGQPALVLGRDVGEEEVDRDRDTFDRLAIAFGDQLHDAVDLGIGQRCPDRAVVRHALADADAVAAQHVRGRLHPLEVVEPFAVDALDEGNVLEPGRGQVEGPLARALQQAVRRDRRAEDEVTELVRCSRQAPKRLENGVGGLTRRGGDLDDVALARLLLDGDEIGERPAGVDADAKPAGGGRLRRQGGRPSSRAGR